MTINDLRNSGIPLQGKKIRVSVWDGSDEPVQELFWEYELSGNCDRAFPETTGKRIDKIMEMEITFIYAVDGVLNIEVYHE
jgi:hypothetical protein